MNIIFLLFILLAGAKASTVGLPIFNNGGSIGHGSEDLKNRRGELRPPPQFFEAEELNRSLFSDTREDAKLLRRVKYLLINGEVPLASVHLSKLAYTRTKLRPIIYRYIGVLAFIEGDYRKSYEFLSRPVLLSTPNYSKICLLRTLNQVILGITTTLEEDWSRCKVETYNHLRPENLVWMDTLVQLKVSSREGITKVPFKRLKLAALNNDELKIFLKLALYLNQEQMLLPEINELSLEQLKDTEVRELVGHILFRTGSLAKSYRFIEDLKTPNAETIKGNLYVLRNKYELAYAQFKLALQQKQNSQNAMERLLPLAWLLGDWKGGSEISERVISSPQTRINKMTLSAAFLMQKGDYDEATELLDHISEKSGRGTEIDVTQLYSFVALMQNKAEKVQKNADLSCAQYDLVNCWTLFQLEQWGHFPLTIRREEKVQHKKLWEKLATEEINEPLEEVVYVNQLDIEELDDKLIQLVPEQAP